MTEIVYQWRPALTAQGHRTFWAFERECCAGAGLLDVFQPALETQAGGDETDEWLSMRGWQSQQTTVKQWDVEKVLNGGSWEGRFCGSWVGLAVPSPSRDL